MKPNEAQCEENQGVRSEKIPPPKSTPGKGFKLLVALAFTSNLFSSQVPLCIEESNA